MENKYFTPDIEDFHVGYECEIYENEQYVSYVISHIIVGGNTRIDIPDGRHWSIQNKLRVPYLTKEQIEAEGWKYLSEGYTEHQAFYKDDFQMSCFYDKHLLKIIKKESLKTIVLYQGSCRCINDLKKIIKLLGI